VEVTCQTADVVLLVSSSVPLALAVPAATAGLAYLNARSAFWYDLHLLRCVVGSGLQLFLRQRYDRLNQFYVLEQAATNPATANRPLLLFEGKTYTYKQVYECALKFGTWLRQQCGVKPKDIVALDFQNSDSFIFVWLGLWAIGAKPAFINYNLYGRALVHCVKAATTRLMIVDPAVAENVSDDVKKQLASVQFVILTQQLEAKTREPGHVGVYFRHDRNAKGCGSVAGQVHRCRKIHVYLASSDTGKYHVHGRAALWPLLSPARI
jgi:AMP-binding enzyme